MAQKERWASRVGLVLAMAGNAVGLGNFLRFPAQAAMNGGGAFLIPYFVALVLMGLPLMWVEWTMGRYGGQHGHHSAPGVFQVMGRNRMWKYFGVFGLWTCLVIASYYLYIESWCLAYACNSIIGGFVGKDQKGVVDFFNALTGEQSNGIFAFSPWGMGVFAICISINIFILSRGLVRGIELVAKVGMPLLIGFAIVLAVRGLMINPDTDPLAKTSAFEGLNFVWQPEVKSLGDPSVWLAAAGQIFFTLSIGMGSIHCYASYLREKDDVALTGATTAWTNEFCEVVLGGTILIPIAVAYLGLTQVEATARTGGGFEIGFLVFPTLFNNWGAFAPAAGFLWFGLLFFAAITSSLAMGQPIMAFLGEEFGMRREKCALALGGMVLALAIPVAVFNRDSFFEEFDYFAGTLMLVVFALVETVLFAWVFGMTLGWQELNKGAELWVPKVFYFIIKYVTPLLLLIILASYVFKPEGDWGPYLQKLSAGEPVQWRPADNGLIGVLTNKGLRQQLADPTLDEGKRGFLRSLMVVRTLDRLYLLLVFAFLAYLVHLAWKKRHAEGRE
ncbi:MAG: sodium-dependent transporter [Gemmataceae bacterium]